MNQLNKNQRKDQKERLRSYARFTGIAFQMGAIIYGGNYLGIWLDSEYNSDKFEPIITLSAVFASMYIVIVQVIKASKN